MQRKFGFQLITVGLYTRFYLGRYDPPGLWMVDDYGTAFTGGGLISDNGKLGQVFIEDEEMPIEPNGWLANLTVAKGSGHTLVTWSMEWFSPADVPIPSAGKKVYSWSRAHKVFGALLKEVNINKVFRKINLNENVPQFPFPTPLKGKMVLDNMFSEFKVSKSLESLLERSAE
jgi:hypothetical protein